MREVPVAWKKEEPKAFLARNILYHGLLSRMEREENWRLVTTTQQASSDDHLSPMMLPTARTIKSQIFWVLDGLDSCLSERVVVKLWECGVERDRSP